MSDEFSDLRARYERLSRLYEVVNTIHSTLDPQKAIDLILREAARITGATRGSIALVNPTSGLLETHASLSPEAGAEEHGWRPGEGLAGWVVRSGRPVRVGDVSKDARCIGLRPGARSALAVPLEVAGETRGALCVDSEQTNAFTDESQDLLEGLAIHASKAIHHTWLYEQLRLKAQLFEAVANISQTINSALGQDDVLRVITREACALAGARVCSLMLLDESRDWLELRAAFGAGEAYLRQGRLSVEESFLGAVLRRKKPMQLENVQTSSRYQRTETARAEGLVALLSVPLVVSGHAIGTLAVYKDVAYVFSNDEIRALSVLAGLSAIAIEKARLHERSLQVEEQLRHSEKLSALGLLAAEVAHEIRNPLTVMKMLYHSLDLQFPGEDPRAKDAQVIQDKMEHLNRIVERILDFARTSEPQFASVNLNDLAQDLALLGRSKLKHHQIELRLELCPDLPLVLADAAQLEQAFLNLILNAIDAMPGGGVLTVRSRRCQQETESAAQEVIMEFQDTGCGMPEAQRTRAFKSVLASTKSKGTGLGLAIVSRIIEAHQGGIGINSGPGRGTLVIIRLPVAVERTPR